MERILKLSLIQICRSHLFAAISSPTVGANVRPTLPLVVFLDRGLSHKHTKNKYTMMQDPRQYNRSTILLFSIDNRSGVENLHGLR